MLYVSTRDRTDSFTAYRALQEEKAPSGGLFVPHRLPDLNESVQSLMGESFGENVARVLNCFFSTSLTGWDVDFLVGRHPLRLVMMNHRLVVAELWRNHAQKYDFLEESLYKKLSGTVMKMPTDWARIAIRIAVLFGIFSELHRQGIDQVDIAVATGDFSVPMAVWYAREMGLPVGKIICGCNENGAVWDLIHRGEFSTGASLVKTQYPAMDHSCPASIERLIYSVLGLKEAQRYVSVCNRRGTYQLDEESLQMLSDGLAASVVSGKRTRDVIKSIYRTSGYIVDGYTATSYGSLQDYRSRTGESRLTLLLCDQSPVHALGQLTEILELSSEEIKKKL